MPRKSLAQIELQIEKLRLQAEAIRNKERAEVIAQILPAIAHYNLTADDLFGPKAVKVGAKSKKQAARKATKEAPAPAKRRAPSAQAGAKVAVKYRDSVGNAWTGRGSQPRWLKAALAEGKALADFQVG